MIVVAASRIRRHSRRSGRYGQLSARGHLVHAHPVSYVISPGDWLAFVPAPTAVVVEQVARGEFSNSLVVH